MSSLELAETIGFTEVKRTLNLKKFYPQKKNKLDLQEWAQKRKLKVSCKSR